MNADSELKKTLQRWNPEVIVPHRFQSEVWIKIAERERKHPFSFLRDRWKESSDLFPRFVIGMPCLALVLTLSIWGGQIQSDHESKVERVWWQTQYLNSIDPYAMTRNRHVP